MSLIVKRTFTCAGADFLKIIAAIFRIFREASLMRASNMDEFIGIPHNRNSVLSENSDALTPGDSITREFTGINVL